LQLKGALVPCNIDGRATSFLTRRRLDRWPSQYTTPAISKRLSPSLRLLRKLCLLKRREAGRRSANSLPATSKEEP
jgi:hypothetical protein